jgi:hypothetical protein
MMVQHYSQCALFGRGPSDANDFLEVRNTPYLVPEKPQTWSVTSVMERDILQETCTKKEIDNVNSNTYMHTFPKIQRCAKQGHKAEG